MTPPETPNLLFFDTFSHDTSEELNLDLVQFPKSVYVREIRVIPLGARVEGDFPGGVRLGATNPTKFQIDFFVNDLSKPGAPTFEALGSLEYCQNGQIHMECGPGLDQPQIPTDGLVLKGWYTTITLAVYGNLTQVVSESPISVNPPPAAARPSVVRDPLPVQPPPLQDPNWDQDSNPIPSYTGNVATADPATYTASYPETYDAYRNDFYDQNAPKDPRGYVEEEEWEKRELSCEREGRMRRSSRSMELERDRERREGRRERTRDVERPYSRSRSRDQDYALKGEYRGRSRSGSRGPSYKQEEYRRHRDASPYDRTIPYNKGSPYEYERKRHSPYSRNRGSSHEGRDDPRKRPRTPPGDTRRPPSKESQEASSPVNSIRSEETGDRSGKQIPRVDFYHQTYRHKNPIRSPSQDVEPPYVDQRTSLVTVPIVEDSAPKVNESPPPAQNDEDKSMDVEQFEPILSDEDICDDLESPPYMDVDYDLDYCGTDDVIKYYNPFKCQWKKYQHLHKIHLIGENETTNVLTATFDELCEASQDLYKITELLTKKSDQKVSIGTFAEMENSAREEWVHQCEHVFVSMTNLCKNTDIILRIFPSVENKEVSDFDEIRDSLLMFTKIGLNFELALSQQQPTYKIRHMKCGIRLAEALAAHRHNQPVTEYLLGIGLDLPMLLLAVYSKEYMALSIRLMILKSLNGCLSSKLAIDNFMKETVFPKFDKNDDRKLKNGYQALVSIMTGNPLTRIKFAISALIKKLNMYELLGKLNELVMKFNDKSESHQKLDAVLSDSDIDFITGAFVEVVHTYRTQCFHMSQPKRFLPVSAQFEVSKECSNEVLLEFFNIHQILEVCLYILTCPTTAGNLVVVSPVHDLVHELVHSENGIDFLYGNMELSELLFKTLMQPYGQNPDEFIYPHDLTNYTELQVLGLELAYRLKALFHLKSICDLQAGQGDENELIDRLQALYCLSFGSVGKTAVPDVIVMGDRADCLMEVFEVDQRTKGKTESQAKQKSPAKGYAIELIVAAIRFSAHVPFLKKYGQRLIAVSKEHDRFEPSVSSVLQEVIPYLKPIEKATVLAGEDLAEIMELIKACSEHAADLPGELTTCLRVLRHFCIADYDKSGISAGETSTEEYVELKYKYNVLQLFSLDGVLHLAGILDKLATHFDQPSVHTSFFASAKGLQLAQMLLPCLRLLDEMLARAVRCRGPRFRDMTAAPVLLKSYGIAKTFPPGCVGYRTADRAAEASVRALLAYAQPIADDAKDGDSIRRGPWTSLCSEVISYTMTAPYTFVPGLLVFSELLPLPLPMQTRTTPTERELADAANERRLWSAHLHALSNELTDMIQIICMSTYRPVVHMLRRVCVQVADLAANTACAVARAAVGAVSRELHAGEPASAAAARVLGFLACLVSHAPVKCAVIHAMSGIGGGSGGVQAALCAVLSSSHTSAEHAAAQEFAAHALAALCDIEITLTPATTEALIANSLPSKEAVLAFLEASADCLESGTKTCAVAQSILRAYFVLTDHEHGFQLFRKFVAKKRDALGKFFLWCAESGGEDRAECLSLYVDLMRLLAAEEGAGRRGALAPRELADMVGYVQGDLDHPVMKLENILKDRNSEEDALAVHIVAAHLSQEEASAAPAPAAAESPGAPASAPPPVPAPLAAQFVARCVHGAEAAEAEDRLSATYWLNLPVLPDDDDANDAELVSCDLVEIAKVHLSEGGACGGAALCGAVRRLAGCLETRAAPRRPAAADKRPTVALSRVRGDLGPVDTFRSRPPNTSRPPSLHVDDFTARAHRYPHPHAHAHAHQARGMRRGAGGGGVAAGADRGRFASAAPVHTHYRQMRGRGGGGGAWEGAGAGAGAAHFGHFAPSAHYMMGGMGWAGGRMRGGGRHRNFMR